MIVGGIKGITYKVDQTPIGSGGEGDVFRAFIPRVIKKYKHGVMTQELENKLRIMTDNPPNEAILAQVAWPLDVIYDENAQCTGFIMPDLSINAELGEIYKYPSTLPISVHQKVNIAQNICVVISEVHKAGYVFGDFNPRNIGLDVNTGLVSFLDTDSYHVVDPIHGNTYRCNVCAPGYAAPELLEKCSDYISENPSASKTAYSQTPLPTFTQETDNFALAIHIFKLLMNGYTPFGGIIETASVSQSSPGVGDMAVRRDSYCFKPGYKHQSAAIPALEAFPHEIADLFSRAFIAGRQDPGQRPSAVEWHLALSKYAESLVTCRGNPLHQYDSKNDVCPYCEADIGFGAVVSGEVAPVTVLKQTAYTPPPEVAQIMPNPTEKSVILQKLVTSVGYITIKGKRYSTALKELDLNLRGLTNDDIVQLKNMTDLIKLNLGGNQISDLRPLTSLESLIRLFLHKNHICDLSSLSGLTNLKILTLDSNVISNIKPLLWLPNLTYLSLSNNQITDWSPVVHVPSVIGRPFKK